MANRVRCNGGHEFEQALRTPASATVLHCYASHGVGYGKNPSYNTAIRILAIKAARDTRWVEAYFCAVAGFVCEPLAGTEWRRLGYVQADGSTPWGPLNAVDPLLAQFDYLPACHSAHMLVMSSPAGLNYETQADHPKPNGLPSGPA